MNYFIHEKAYVETTNIGNGTTIWAYTHILPEARIGNEVTIGEQCFVENTVVMGNRVTIKNGVSLWDGLTIEDDVFVGPNASFTNDLFPRSKNHSYIQKKTSLKKGCSIGANATIIAGVRIGLSAMVGAGAVVTKDVEDFALVYGNPAKAHGYVCICGEKLSFTDNFAHCTCARKYSKTNEGVKQDA